jgi:hypothetical protein
MDNSETNAERIADAVKAGAALIALTMAASGLLILTSALLIASAISLASGQSNMSNIINFLIAVFLSMFTYFRTWVLSEKFLGRNK